MRIAVFGAGGFVGGWICEELSERQDIELLACVRQWASAVRLARRGLQIRQMDLENATAFPALLAGVDVVVNAAMLPASLSRATDPFRSTGALMPARQRQAKRACMHFLREMKTGRSLSLHKPYYTA